MQIVDENVGTATMWQMTENVKVTVIHHIILCYEASFLSLLSSSSSSLSLSDCCHYCCRFVGVAVVVAKGAVT